jgi:hypothetical protein
MIRSLYCAVQERRWNRDRTRRIAKLRARDHEGRLAVIDRVDQMALQLAEIRMLPETPEPRR